MKTYRGFTIVKADRGSHRWHAELDGTHVEFRRGKVTDADGSIVDYCGAYFTTLRALRGAIDLYRANESGVQRFESAYGREAIEVSHECPTAAIRWLLGRVHVGAPFEEIEAEIRRRVNVATDPRWTPEKVDEAIRFARWTPEKVDEAIRFARWEHAENRALYSMVA